MNIIEIEKKLNSLVENFNKRTILDKKISQDLYIVTDYTTLLAYNPDKTPADLREAHYRLDLAIEQCHRNKPFESDEERLEYLFKMYEKMVGEEK